jgi:hypothetical protein
MRLVLETKISFSMIYGPENQSLKLMTMLYGQVWGINNW